jgi:hypothetical protein
MRKWLIRMATAVTLALNAAPALAQEVTQSSVQEGLRVGALHQALYTRLLGVFQSMPAYPDGKADAALREWRRQSRDWIAATRSVIGEVRRGVAELPPVPAGLPGGVQQALSSQHQKLPEMISGVEQFVSRYSEGLDAIDRGDANGAQKMALSALDSAVMTLRLMRNINADQAEFLGDHPQSSLLRSVARSYDGMLAIVAVQRANIVGDAGDREAAARIVTDATADMRRLADLGKRTATTMITAISAGRSQNPDEGSFQERVIVAFRTYSGSFDRELEIAALLDRAAGLLRDGRSYETIAPELEALNLRVATLDDARAADIQRRMSILQGQ